MQTSPSSVVTPATPTELFSFAFDSSTGAGDVSTISATHNTAAFHAEADEPLGQGQLPTLLGPHVPNMLGSVNMGLGEFLDEWSHPVLAVPEATRPDYPHLLLETSKQLTKIRRVHLRGDRCDFQGINWSAMGVTRQLARARRARTFQNYTSWPGSDDDPQGADVRPRPGPTLLGDENPFSHSTSGLASGNYFRFREMHIREEIALAHFQLRSSLASPFRSQIHYVSRLGISKVDPVTGNHGESLQWTEFPVFGRAFTTLGANQDVLVAGSFTGEYVISSLHSTDIQNFTQGTITEAASGITNHLQVHKQRSTSNPVASICSNDNGFRVLDLETQQFVSEFGYGFALNCSAVSPDCRLRVMVGDSKDVTIANAETGDTEVTLTGHDDFGFACDWSDDGRYLATGFQDKTIKIWDPRRWKDANGTSTPLQHFRTDLAGARGLKFSPLGSGESVLAAAEEADHVHVYSTHAFGRETYDADTRQTFSVFGELGGIDFAEGGQELNVLVADEERGGILQLERCGTRRDATDAIPLF
ncbi:WD40-repeat-containing domain protein [Emericellopsis atlantica]|uniref:WD40-repeat-containing domain protein n=1 Tax=Emericellopsis atlantica TaxID=2614577 RepID=A0A9P7ZNN5_9HYPO|nr:WD40-repeat-containing domain protein [Emericellopsis atlantica]KAG9255047.1 WD40-repeat-containing domain protein [Emericellopsis atlantica]